MADSDFQNGRGKAAEAAGPNPAPPAGLAAETARPAVLSRPTPPGEADPSQPAARKLAPASAAPPAAAARPAPPPPSTAPGPDAPPPAAARPAAPTPAASSAPSIEAFLSPGGAHRLRDLVAFGMAVEVGKPATPDAVDTLRRQADAELEAYAFRSLHNRVEEIRRSAIDEQLGKLRQTPGFQGIIVANLVAMIAAAMIALLLWWLHAVFTMGS